MIENSVVLPAPFGPMSAVMRPCSAANDARSSASNPPKRFDTCSTRNRGSTMAAPQRCRYSNPGCQDALAQIEQNAGNPARRHCNDQNEYASVDHEIEAGGTAGRQLGEFSERLDDECTQQWTEQRAHASDDGSEQCLDRNPGTIGDAGINEQEVLRIEATACRGDGRRDRHGPELDDPRVHTECLRGIFIFSHGDQIGAEAAAFDDPHEHHRDADETDDDPVERRPALKLESLGTQIELDERADSGSGDGSYARDNAQHLCKGQRDEGEVRPLQPRTEAQHAYQGSDQRAHGNADAKTQPGVDAIAHLEDSGDVGAGAEERSMAE